MSGADYFHCPICDRKALYDHDESGETPDVEVLHRECLAKLRDELARVTGERDDALKTIRTLVGHPEPSGTEASRLVERECPAPPVTPGVTDDGLHCECWQDGGACCRCKAPASGTEASHDEPA